LQLARGLRFPAIFCALAVFLCELISRPYANMGIADDGPDIIMAHTLATVGHIVYTGWAAPMLICQLYLAAAFVKLFGFSFTAVRFSTLLVAMLLAFMLQRTLVLAGITERNATIGTLAFVLSPLYLMLSVTYMTDIFGLFAIVVCLYGCLRALHASTPRGAILWICFAVITNAFFGTSRQISWLGILVMVPSTLWLLRARRNILIAGTAAVLTGALFVFACLQWLARQPYTVPEHLLIRPFSVALLSAQSIDAVLDLPFLLLPLVVVFLPELRKIRPFFLAVFSTVLFGYLFLALYPSHLRGSFILVPGAGMVGEWVNSLATFDFPMLHGSPPIWVPPLVQAFFTALTMASVLGLIVSVFRSRRPLLPASGSSAISWLQLGTLLGPFFVAYVLLLIPRGAAIGLHDRYFLALLLVALIFLIRYFQDRVYAQLPLISVLLIGVMTIYGVTATHDMFSFYRARVALADELRANGVPPTSVDNGWEYNFNVQILGSGHINNPAIIVPAHLYAPRAPLGPGSCSSDNLDYTPLVRPIYGVSFNPNACYGPAPFAPVHYSRWPYRTPGTLYVVHYLPPATP